MTENEVLYAEMLAKKFRLINPSRISYNADYKLIFFKRRLHKVERSQILIHAVFGLSVEKFKEDVVEINDFVAFLNYLVALDKINTDEALILRLSV